MNCGALCMAPADHALGCPDMYITIYINMYIYIIIYTIKFFKYHGIIVLT